MTDKKLSKSQTEAATIAALFRARNSLLWIVSREESRSEGYLFEAAASAGYVPYTWDVAAGFCNMAGQPLDSSNPPETADVSVALDQIKNMALGGSQRRVWIMRDLAPWLEGLPGARPCRQLRNLARLLPTVERSRSQAIVVLSTTATVPSELAGHAVVIDWPLPDRQEIARILDAAIVGAQAAGIEPPTKDVREAAIDAAVGLSGEESASCYAKSLVQLKRIDPATVAQEKKRVVTRERIIQWYDPIPGGLDAIGGLDGIKSWVNTRKAAYTPEARAYGLPTPRGILVVGPPGTGKSLLPKCLATAWEEPLLKVDLGGIKSKFVGESESNLRKVWQVIAAIGRCVVWFDEIEKALAGATQGAADGGVSADALGSMLGWMQERTDEAFIVATCNDVRGLPPELLRKGRFDEVFFVDLPNTQERAEILKATLKNHGREGLPIDHDCVAEMTREFTGSEIAALVPDAMFAAFNDGGREIVTNDLLVAAKTTTPMAVGTAAEKIKALRLWAQGKARPASTMMQAAPGNMSQRQVDL